MKREERVCISSIATQQEFEEKEHESVEMLQEMSDWLKVAVMLDYACRNRGLASSVHAAMPQLQVVS